MATMMAKGSYLTPEQIAAMHEGRRRALAEGRMESPNHIDGRASHPEYNRWYNMMARCTKPNHPMYPNYGARGISVCEEWHDPFVFYQYLEQMGPCPEGHSLDRINNNGNYEPGNVRWASPKEQRANSRDPWLTRQR